MRQNSVARILGLVAAVLLATTQTASAKAPLATVQFDCTVTHPYTGFGLNIWPLPGRSPALLQLLSDLRVNFVRWSMLPPAQRKNVPDGLSYPGLIDWLENLAVTQRQLEPDRGFAVLQRVQSLGIAQMPASWGVPRGWRMARAEQQEPSSGKRMPEPIDEMRVDDYGRLVAAGVAVLLRHGIKPYAIELLNEPAGKLRPREYVDLIRSFRASQAAVGVAPTPIAGPGTARTIGNAPYLRALQEQRTELDIVSTHAYDGGRKQQLTGLAAVRAALPPGARKPVFVTEYGIGPRAWFQQDEASDTEAYAIVIVAQTLALLGDGASTAFFWQAQDVPWKPDNMGLLSRKDEPRPSIAALRPILQTMQAGDLIATAQPREQPLPLLLVSRPSQLVLQLANPGIEPQDYAIQLRNCTAKPLTVTRSNVWPSDRSVTTHTAGVGGLQVQLPPQSVASLTIER